MKKIEAVKGCIYKLTNLINGHAYFGKHKNVLTVEKRWDEHIDAATKKGKASRYLHSAISSYGADKFHAAVIWEGPNDRATLNIKERWFIKKFHTFIGDPKYNGGYNLTPGGDGATEMIAATRKKIAEALRGRVLSADHCSKISKARKGKPLSAEHCVKLSLAQLLRCETLAGKVQLAKARGAIMPAAHERQAESLRGYWDTLSEEERAAAVEGMLAVTRTPEVCAKRTAALRTPDSRAKNSKKAKVRAATARGKAHLIAMTKAASTPAAIEKARVKRAATWARKRLEKEAQLNAKITQ